MTLKTYSVRRNFSKTSEPKAEKRKQTKPIFVIQKHFARSLHFDFRIAYNGVLKSWAVPKGMPKTTKERRLAIQTEDHPIS